MVDGLRDKDEKPVTGQVREHPQRLVGVIGPVEEDNWRAAPDRPEVEAVLRTQTRLPRPTADSDVLVRCRRTVATQAT